jgi:serine/threonine-protein kinase
MISAELGGGGMGVVYKAIDIKLDRPVALKFLPPELTRDPDAKRRFVHEAKAASALQHHNICTIHEIDETDDGRLFISMDCYEGETLKQIVAKGPSPVDLAINTVVQAAEGLAKAHEAGVVHRDIKSANLIMTSDGVLKILDFGLAKLVGQTKMTKTGMTVGTVCYMSPEQARGDAVDHRTDIWSLGVILYEMLTGQLPFRGSHEQAVIYQVVHEIPEPITALRTDAPIELERIVNKALAKDPGERYQHVAEFLIDIKSIDKAVESKAATAGHTKARPLNRKKAVWYGSIAAVVVSLIGAGLLFLHYERKSIESIAVLPLENLSGDPEQDYFVDGMTEALIAELTQIGALKVISRTSVMRYKDTDKLLPQIARELDVDAIVEGSVLREGNQVRITAQLVHASTDRHLWADHYDRERRDILALYSEVAQAIVSEIQVTLTPQEQTRLASVRPVNPEAHELYLRGLYHYNKRWTKGEFEKAIQYFQQAIDIDPNHAQSYAGLARSYEWLCYLGALPLEEADAKFYPALRKALEIDETLLEARLALAKFKFYEDWDWAGAETEFKRTLALNPNSSDALYEYAWFLMSMGEFSDAIAHAKRALRLDPFSFPTNNTLAFVYYNARHYGQAAAQWQQLIDLGINDYSTYAWLATTYIQMGRYEEAVGACQEALTIAGIPPETVESLGLAFSRSGSEGYWKWHLKYYKGRYEQHPATTAAIYTHLGDKDQAFFWLQKAYEKHDGAMFRLKVSPRWDLLRDDPRFENLLRLMDFPG